MDNNNKDICRIPAVKCCLENLLVNTYLSSHGAGDGQTDRRTDGQTDRRGPSTRAVSSDARKADGCCCGDAMTGLRKLRHRAGQEGSLSLTS